MARLSQLPQELFLGIVELLEGNNATLAALCLISRAVAEVSRPYLYRHVVLGAEDAKPTQIALFLRTLFDRPDYATQTKILQIEATVYRDRNQDFEVPSGATGMRMDDGTRLEEACVDHVRCIEQNGAPRISAMIQKWRLRLRSGAQTAYVGVLLSLLVNLKDIAITIYTEEGLPRRTFTPLERLFRLSVGAFYQDDGSHLKLRPHLPLFPTTRDVTRLRTTGANLAILCLGFANLQILEVDLQQSNCSRSNGAHLNWENGTTEFQPRALLKVHTINFDSDWEALLVGYRVRHLLETIRFPSLRHFFFSIVRGPTQHLEQYGNFRTFFESIQPIATQLERVAIDVGGDRTNFSMSCLNAFKPVDLGEGDLFRFSSLQVLRIPSAAFVGRCRTDHTGRVSVPPRLDDLGPYLEHLDITYPDGVTLEWLQNMFATLDVNQVRLRLISLSCAWDCGKPPSWFERRRHLLDNLPCPVVIGVVPGQKQPDGYVDKEVTGIWHASLAEGVWLDALFEE
ncbi:hypothetical protein EK21DRAFT_89354 [Setomelanomma holmii]|uniref:F-box domain-containing protein n=1 Tax=Setomelanomma holmii TaxID=210430 RepID=A0A9P4H883_9PLEO|nr:hypothetical protein EK21DRAFT_89354 [Setomelanomma holmii]